MYTLCASVMPQLIYYIQENVYGGKLFAVFKSFPVNYGLVDQQYKSTECYSESFTGNCYFPLKMWKFFPTMFSYCTYLYNGLDGLGNTITRA